MTKAICVKCGATKLGAWPPCPTCKHMPRGLEELTLSLAYTDHYFDATTLDGFAKMIQLGAIVDPDPELLDEIREKISADPAIAKLLAMTESSSQAISEPSIEQHIWSQLKVAAISELEGFPFPTYAEFVASVHARSTLIGIDYSAAREFSSITKSKLGEGFLLALSWVPFALAIASVGLPMSTGNWWMLIGAPVGLVGMFIASPYNPFRRWIIALAIVALAYWVITGPTSGGLAWSCFVLSVAIFSVWILNSIAWHWAYHATLRSEAIAALFYSLRRLLIKSVSTGQVSSVGYSRGAP